MNRSLSHRAFALVYGMLISVCFLVFFAALVLSSRQTMKAVQYDEQLVRARGIAAAGNQLVFELLSARDDDWYTQDFSFSNESGASDYFQGNNDPELEAAFSEASLGGRFRVRVLPAPPGDEENPSQFQVPEGGSFFVLSCTARVGRRETTVENSSRLLVKLTNPFVNNLTVARETMGIVDGSLLKGPVLVDGDVPLVAHTMTNPVNPLISIFPFTVRLASHIRASGRILLVNTQHGTPGYTAQTVLPKGSYADGFTETLPAPTYPGATIWPGGIGGLQVQGEATLEPLSSGFPRIPSSAELFEGIRLVTNSETFDTTPYPEGLLVEFEDQDVRVYRMVPTTIGRVYDLSILTSIWANTNPSHGRYVTQFKSYRHALKEAAWDEPRYPDAPIPTELRDLAWSQYSSAQSGAVKADIPTTGDYFELKTPGRGAELAHWQLTGDTWKVLRFTATALSGADGDGNSMAPPIFVRGRVQGRVIVAYDLDDALLPLDLANDRDLCDIVVVNEGEGTVPGGIRLANESVASDYQTQGSSPDYFMAVSQGGVKPWGLPIELLNWVDNGSPTGRDLYAETLGSLTATEKTLLDQSSNMARAVTFYGVGCGARADFKTAQHGSDLKVFTKTGDPQDPYPGLDRGTLWQDLDPGNTRDGELLASDRVIVPWLFRVAHRPYQTDWISFGAHSSSEDLPPSPIHGIQTYDYRWRSLDAEQLHQHMGLPLTLSLIDRQGY